MSGAAVAPLVVAERLQKTFGSGAATVRAIDGVDFEVGRGEIVLIMGPSGSGKTTLLSMLGGLLRPTSGRVLIADLDISAAPERRLIGLRRELVGFIFQSFNLIETLNVLENVEIALNVGGTHGEGARVRATALLGRFGLEHRLAFQVRDISGGEKQRVSVARALANNPLVILADEPTANLDAANGAEVMRLLRELAHEDGRAILVVSHDERIRAFVDRVLWLEDGKLRNGGPASPPV
jgi:putative ABC transport system ATP-binding protein